MVPDRISPVEAIVIALLISRIVNLVVIVSFHGADHSRRLVTQVCLLPSQSKIKF